MSQPTNVGSKTCRKGHFFDVSQVYCPDCGRMGVEARPETPRQPPRDREGRPERLRPVDEATRARASLKDCWVLGFFLAVLGGVIAGMAFSEQSGGGLALGLTLAGIGQIVLFIAVIGTGVRLGIQSAARGRS